MLEILIALNVSLLSNKSLILVCSGLKPVYSQVSRTNTSSDSTPSSDTDTAPRRGAGRRE